MGAVYAAEDLRHGRRVAIKLLLPTQAARKEVRDRFDREARVAAQIESEHTIRLFDSGEVAEGPYAGSQFIIMECLRGTDLERFEKRAISLPVGLAVELILQATKGLAAAHRRGVIHRDIKPANLFVSVNDEAQLRLKVLDFGISKIADGAGLTKPQSALGTAYYMSPEQTRSANDVDVRTDIWSLGASLYVALTGLHPFDGHNLGELFARILQSAPTPPSELNPNVAKELDAIVLRCLEKSADARFNSMEELATALTPFADGRGGSAWLGLVSKNGEVTADIMRTQVLDAAFEPATGDSAPASPSNAGPSQRPTNKSSAGGTNAGMATSVAKERGGYGLATAAAVTALLTASALGIYFYARQGRTSPSAVASEGRSEQTAREVEGTPQPVGGGSGSAQSVPTAALSPATTEIAPTASLTSQTSPLSQGAKSKPTTTSPPAATPPANTTPTATPPAATTPTVQSNPPSLPPPTKVWCKSVDEKGNPIVKKCS